MRILFVASELTPIAKVGGLGDVAGALPKALRALGVDVRVVLPHYDVIDRSKYPVERVGAFSVATPKGEETVTISTTPIPGTSVPVYLLYNDAYLSHGGIYFERSAFVGSFKEIERFLFFSRATVALLDHWSEVNGPRTILRQAQEVRDRQVSGVNNGWLPDVIHCQDWHTAAIPLFLKAEKRSPKTLFTIHNLANQGRWSAKELLPALGFDATMVPSLTRQHTGDLSLMEQGILNCDMVNTVSPTYAKEILTPEFGESIEASLRERQKDLVGIVNGIDTDRFNPATDPDIATPYAVLTLDKKQENKEALLRTVGLPVSDAPLLGLVSRLTDQKGIDLVCGILDRVRERGGRGVFLGTGDPKLEECFVTTVRRHPKNLFVKIGFDAGLAQKIYAGADLFLMPSRFEPCGLGQMIAMRYGTLPIVRATGGLKDTVRDDETGFVFTNYNAEALWGTIERALSIYRDVDRWRAMQKKAMEQNFSWEASAREYVRLYELLAS